MNLEQLLTSKGLTIAAAAEASGVSRSYLSQVIHGHCPLSAKTARRLAPALGVRPESLFAGLGDMEPVNPPVSVRVVEQDPDYADEGRRTLSAGGAYSVPETAAAADDSIPALLQALTRAAPSRAIYELLAAASEGSEKAGHIRFYAAELLRRAESK